jgi:hypothetical protein
LQLEESGFLTEPPTVTPEQFVQLEARWKQSGVEISAAGGWGDGAGGVSATLALQPERVREAQARGTRVELWFADEARIGKTTA